MRCFVLLLLLAVHVCSASLLGQTVRLRYNDGTIYSETTGVVTASGFAITVFGVFTFTAFPERVEVQYTGGNSGAFGAGRRAFELFVESPGVPPFEGVALQIPPSTMLPIGVDVAADSIFLDFAGVTRTPAMNLATAQITFSSLLEATE